MDVETFYWVWITNVGKIEGNWRQKCRRFSGDKFGDIKATVSNATVALPGAVTRTPLDRNFDSESPFFHDEKVILPGLGTLSNLNYICSTDFFCDIESKGSIIEVLKHKMAAWKKKARLKKNNDILICFQAALIFFQAIIFFFKRPADTSKY